MRTSSYQPDAKRMSQPLALVLMGSPYSDQDSRKRARFIGRNTTAPTPACSAPSSQTPPPAAVHLRSGSRRDPAARMRLKFKNVQQFQLKPFRFEQEGSRIVFYAH